MPFIETPIKDLLIFEPKVFADDRGYFFECYNQQAYEQQGLSYNWVQDNQAHNVRKGIIRGLHYQLNPHAQSKLVRVLDGAIWDVAVDIRQGSPTFGQWFGLELNATNKLQLLIPRGFAHGYSVLSETAEVMYKCDNFYSKVSEGGILYNDPQLAIDWKVDTADVLVSEKDAVLPLFKDCVNNFEL